jgi:hypothetical protein
MNYDLSDNISGLQTNVLYYRLKSFDTDGKFEYSETRMVRLDKKAESTTTFLTYPNPVINELKVSLPLAWQNKNVTIEILGTTGSLTSKTQIENSSQVQIINMSSLQPGFYIVRVLCNGQYAQQKVIKQ